MNRRTRLQVCIFCGLLLFGTAGLVMARGQSENEETQEPKYTGSIPVAEQTDTEGLSAEVMDLAKISMDDAVQTVLALNKNARLVGIELDIENGYLVYSVSLNDGEVVKVDAGNGEILYSEKSEEGDRSDRDETEEDEE